MQYSFPLQKVKVRVGLGGSHYHLTDCPAASDKSFIKNPDMNDYLEIEVPKELVDKRRHITYLGRTYVSHIDVCKGLTRGGRNVRKK